MQRRSLRHADRVVAVSGALRDELVGCGIEEARVRVIRNGWRHRDDHLGREPACAELGVAAAGPRIGWVGRFSSEKGPDVMVHALARLGGVQPSLSFIGDGREVRTTQALAKRLSVSDRITWHGQVGAPWRLFKAFDLFVLSSRTEGTPMVLMEALDAGVPLVCTAVGGVAEVIDDSMAALAPPDDPDALAAAIHAVLNDPEGASRRTERARQVLEGLLNMDRWTDAHDAVYQEAVAASVARNQRRSDRRGTYT